MSKNYTIWNKLVPNLVKKNNITEKILAFFKKFRHKFKKN